MSSEKDENPIPPITPPTRTRIVFGSNLVPPKDPVAYAHQDPMMLKLHAQGLQLPLSYGKQAKVPTADEKAPPKLHPTAANTSQNTIEPTITLSTDKPKSKEKKLKTDKAAKKETPASVPQPAASSPKRVAKFDPAKDSFATNKWTVLSVNIMAESKPVRPTLSQVATKNNSNSEGTVLPLSSAIDGAFATDPADFLLRQSTAYPTHKSLVQAELSGRNTGEKGSVVESDKAALVSEPKATTFSDAEDKGAGSKIKIIKTNEKVATVKTDISSKVGDSAQKKQDSSLSHPSNKAGAVPVEKELSFENAKVNSTPVEAPAKEAENSVSEKETTPETLTVVSIDSEPVTELISTRAIEKEVPTKEIVTDKSGLGDPSSFTKPSNSDTPVNQENTSPSTLSKKLVVLIARQAFDRTAIQNQQNAMTILSLRGIQYETIDGADPVNKEERNKLFSLSGLRGKYPQFFLVDGSDKVFWGDSQKFTEANDDGDLEKELGGGNKIPDMKSKSYDTNVVVAAEQSASNIKGDSGATSATVEALVLVLISRQSFDREVIQNQQNALRILDSKRIRYKTIDGADPANKEERNALFALSGLRAKYPQFFLLRGGQKTFYGSMHAFSEANETGTLAQDFGTESAESMVSALAVEITAAKSSEVAEGKPTLSGESIRTLADELGVDPTPTPVKQEMPRETEKVTRVALKEKEYSTGNKSRSLDISATVAGSIKKAPVTDITIFGATSFVAKHVITYMVSFSRRVFTFVVIVVGTLSLTILLGTNKYTP